MIYNLNSSGKNYINFFFFEYILIISILPGKMKLMSKDILEKNIIPEIIQKEIINESFSDILFSEIFKDPIKGNVMISEEYYKNKIIPYIIENLKLRQWGTRIVLLKVI